MRRMTWFVGALLTSMAACLAMVCPAGATTITNGSYDFVSIPDPPPTGTGNGTYDVLLFQQGSGGAGNACCPPPPSEVNVDNSNGTLPTGSTANFSGFWATSIADLRAFFILNFPDGSGGSTISELVLTLDLNEEGGPPNDITVTNLTITKNPTINPGTTPNPATSDLTQAQQEAITGISGGTTLALLGGSQTLQQLFTGGGRDDWWIQTGINPFSPSFSPSDVLVFRWDFGAADNGPELLSISGEFAGCEPNCGPPPTGAPQPAALILLGAGMAGLAGFHSLRRRP